MPPLRPVFGTGRPLSTASANPGPRKPSPRDKERIDKLFYKYANSSSGAIEAEGVERLCADLGVDPSDKKILLFAWKIESKKQGYITLEEWQRGMKELRADTTRKLQMALPGLEDKIKYIYDDFCSFAFRYCLTEEKQKFIDIETVCQLLEILLGSKYRTQVDYFIEFLKEQTDYKVITLDQFMGFYRLVDEISFPDFNNYDADLAWPLIIDDFVDWVKAKQS